MPAEDISKTREWIRVGAPEPEGCARRLAYDGAHLGILGACALSMPLTAYSAWVMVGMTAHGLGMPVPSANPTAILLGTLSAWAWLALGYQALEQRRLRRRAARIGNGAVVGRFRFDRRLRLKTAQGIVYNDGRSWRIEAPRFQVTFDDSDAQTLLKAHRRGARELTWKIGPDQFTVVAFLGDCEIVRNLAQKPANGVDTRNPMR
jgi:hypothetical protein